MPRETPMRARLLVIAVLLLAAWLIIRYTQAGTAAPVRQTQPPAARAAPSAAPTSAAATSAPAPSNHMAAALLPQDIEALVKADLAALLAVAVGDIRIVETVERTWYNDSLGCHIRSGVPVDRPIPGYLIRLEHQAETYNYHTDQHGHFIRCPAPSKPRDRTTR